MANEKISEAKIQSTCVIWLWNEHPETRGCFFSVTNNSEHVVRAANRKALGLVAGVSDCIFIWDGKTYGIEFKTEIGRQSPRQEWWQQAIENQGAKYYIVRSFDEFKALMFQLLKSVNKC